MRLASLATRPAHVLVLVGLLGPWPLIRAPFVAFHLGAASLVIGRMAVQGQYEAVEVRTQVVPPPPIRTAGEPGSRANPESLRLFGELVAGTWEAAGSRHVYEWAVGRKALRSRSYLTDGDGWRLVSEGFWYQDESGGVRGVVVAVGMPFERMEYESRVEGDRVIHDLRTFGADVQEWVETWTFSEHGYTWTLERATESGLEQVMAGEYRRAVP